MKSIYSISLSLFFFCITTLSIGSTHSKGFSGSFPAKIVRARDQIISENKKGPEIVQSVKSSDDSFTNPDSLPFRLLEFKATKKEKPVLLEWQTEAEQRSDKFIIEQSRDGQEFIAIGEVEAKGTSNPGSNHYSFSDKDPAQGNNYYRLIMIDKNGRFNYTTVEKIYNGIEQAVSLFPNEIFQPIR